MSVVPKETIEVIAQSIGINNLSSDVALALGEIMQEAIKCMRHSKRTILTTEDVDSALNLRNIEPLYGFASKDPVRFERAAGHKVIEAPLPRAPLDTSIVAHWLAIEGVQPAIPENPPIEGPASPGLLTSVWSLLHNPHIHMDYLHQMMPSILTCMVAKSLGDRFSDNHWELRNFAANLVATICRRFGHVYSNLQPPVMRTLLHAFLDPTKALPQHYGAIQGLASLGPNVVRLLILPNLEVYMQLLEPEMQLEKQKNELKRQEAWHVYAALQFAAGQCLHGQMMKLPELPLL